MTTNTTTAPLTVDALRQLLIGVQAVELDMNDAAEVTNPAVELTDFDRIGCRMNGEQRNVVAPECVAIRLPDLLARLTTGTNWIDVGSGSEVDRLIARLIRCGKMLGDVENELEDIRHRLPGDADCQWHGDVKHVIESIGSAFCELSQSWDCMLHSSLTDADLPQNGTRREAEEPATA